MLKFIFVFATLLLSPVDVANSQDEPLGWLAFGDIRGYLEPCGCNPTSDLGGIKRIATLLFREKREAPHALVFDLGNNFSFPSDPSLKRDTLAGGLNLLPVDARLFNTAEQQLDGQIQLDGFVLSNMQEHAAFKNKVSLFVPKGDTVIFGFVEDPKNKPWDAALQASWTSLLAPFKDKHKILLFSGSQTILEAIQQSGIFQDIISSNNAPLKSDLELTFYEKEHPESLERVKPPKLARMVPVFGLGVLRGGALQQKEALSIGELLSQDQGSPLAAKKPLDHSPIPGMHMEENLLLSPSIPVTWLSPKYDESSPLENFFQNYLQKATEEFKSNGTKKLAELKDSPFAGSAACETCHKTEYAIWQNSKHAHAFVTLEEKKRQEDSSCVGCHVLGFQDKGGFINKELTVNFLHVQCENCHGPRKEHAQNPQTKPVSSPKDACITCHQSGHSPHFEFGSYWQKIKH